MTMTITPKGSGVFTATVNATVMVNGKADTVSGMLQGTYDLQPHPDPSVAGSGYAVRFTVPSGGSPLTITNSSGMTTQFDVYLVWTDSTSLNMQVMVNSTGTANEASVLLVK
jgi:hypothetical protein